MECRRLHKRSFSNFLMITALRPAKTSVSYAVVLKIRSSKATKKSVMPTPCSIESLRANLSKVATSANSSVITQFHIVFMMANSLMKVSKLSITNQVSSACAEKMIKPIRMNASFM